jgi:uncharacterized protein YkwD
MVFSEILTNSDYDFAIASNGDDVLAYAQLPGDQQSLLSSSGGIDAIALRGGNDVAQDDGGARIYFGNAGNDSIDGGAGADTIAAGRDTDTVIGGSGDDLLFGNKQSDTLLGGDGSDTLFGGQDADLLEGNAGDDWLSGDRGDDFLDGGQGLNQLYGGAGADVFYVGDDATFSHQSSIEDFNAGEDAIAVWGVPLSDVELIDRDFGVVLYDAPRNFEFASVTGLTAAEVSDRIISADGGGGTTPDPSPNPQPTPPDQNPAAYSSEEFEQRVIELVNQERANAGLQPVSFEPRLAQAAETHSQNMAFQDFFSHTGADGSEFSDRMEAAGFEPRGLRAENITVSHTTPEAAVEFWMNSPRHRANILNSEFTQLGVGHYFLENDTGNVNYNHYWTQVFSV